MARRSRSIRGCANWRWLPRRTPRTGVERMEQLAVLARWFYSSWCDGELLMVDDWAKIPYRKLVNAVSRIRARATAASSEHSFLATVLAASDTPGAAPIQCRDIP